MKPFTHKQFLFLLTYPLAHLGLISFLILIAKLTEAWASPVRDVLFMSVLLIVAPILAFPRFFHELQSVLSVWNASSIFVFGYIAILLFFVLPASLLYKLFKRC